MNTVLWALIIGSTTALQCYNGTQGVNSSSVSLTMCDDAVLKCNSPNSTIADNNYTTYGCGGCGTEDKGCIDCNTDSCNNFKMSIVTYKCKMADKDTVCEKKSGEKAVCFRPVNDYMGDNQKLLDGGCGTCDSMGENSTTCSECIAGSTCSSVIANIASAALLLVSLSAWV